MMQFENQFRDHKRFLTGVGSREKITYEARYNPKGQLELHEKGKEDWYGYIQSHKDSVDIHVLLERFQRGDVDVLNRVQGFYGDITGYPSTFADALNIVRSGQEFFDSLPVEERAKYNHNFSEFLASFDSPDNLARIFGIGSASASEPASEPATESVTEPVKEGEK
ncbi:MAG: hypothetical protein QW203_06145 [Thermoplasmatales archaeon]